jgi:hypothetical protein
MVYTWQQIQPWNVPPPIPAVSENGQLPRCLTITVLIGLYNNQQLFHFVEPRVTVFLPKMAVSVGLRLLQFVRSPLFFFLSKPGSVDTVMSS